MQTPLPTGRLPLAVVPPRENDILYDKTVMEGRVEIRTGTNEMLSRNPTLLGIMWSALFKIAAGESQRWSGREKKAK